MPSAAERLRQLRNFPEIVRYLEEELEWPLGEYEFDELTFEYDPEDLGLKDVEAAKIKTIHQLRPLSQNQPWGIFFVEFENKKLPVVVLRRILSHLVLRKRASANKADAKRWDASDLLFISAFGDERTDQREIAFAHFHKEDGDLPTLRVLGWDGADTPLHVDYVAQVLQSRLRWPKDTSDAQAWHSQWNGAFRHRIGHVIRTANGLAETLAGFARGIRDAARSLMEHESEKGPLTSLYKAFRAVLIHDLKPEDFADTYAQTITYGLLTAAVSRTEMSEGRHCLRQRYTLRDNRDWALSSAREALRADSDWLTKITRCLYRPFDVRWCYFDEVAMDYPRRDLKRHVFQRENISLLLPRQIAALPWRHAACSELVAESCLISTDTKSQNYLFPLYLYPRSGSLDIAANRVPNLDRSFLKQLASHLGLLQPGPHQMPKGIEPQEILHYAYAVFHSPVYRSRYAESLKIDFPRLPLPGNIELFRALVQIGDELVALHLLESSKLSTPTTYIGLANPEIEKISYARNTVWLDKAQTRGFFDVPEAVWNFYIGGYQVCEKWLKDRKGRTLSADDLVHYNRIVIALRETIRLMTKIDAVIEKHGGWPQAFIGAGA
jgi:hypothetical protein